MGNLISASDKDLDSPSKSSKGSAKNGYNKREFSLKIPRSATTQTVAKPPKAKGATSARTPAVESSEKDDYKFQKSKSMHELQPRRRRSAQSKQGDAETASTSSGKPASLKQVRLNSSESDRR